MHIKPKKSLGQNFLVDQNIQRKIIEACELKPSDRVLEIGAGRGELTQLIARRVSTVFALEIDSYLCKILKEKLKEYPNVKIINQDILRFNLKRYFLPKRKRFKVIGNIPYYITTPILKYFLKEKGMVNTMLFSVQKEFAKRITADAGSKEYGSLSCYLQFYTKPEELFRIKKSSFSPAPKVDSCFLRFKIKRGTKPRDLNEELLFRIIRAAFNKRRKILKNSLEGVIPEEKLNIFFDKYRIDYNTRPEKLSLKDFINLSKI